MNKKQELAETFKEARETNAPYVFVVINAQGVDEAIVIPKRSIEEKEIFYNKAYNDDLTHIMNESVHVRAHSYGELALLAVII